VPDHGTFEREWRGEGMGMTVGLWIGVLVAVIVGTVGVLISTGFFKR
jgi:hypothetical protein